ncbi:MAG: MFS transporter [Deltaproteobacteria bacterium]|nr:MFS transporter [Deltaproteobacteria bacterium]
MDQERCRRDQSQADACAEVSVPAKEEGTIFPKIISLLKETHMNVYLFRGNKKKHSSRIALEKADKKSMFQAWVVVTAGFFTVLILYGTYYCFGVFVKPMSASLGWSRATITGVIFVNMTLRGIFSIITGRLSDKYEPRFIVVVSALLVALGYALCFRINAPWQLYTYFGVLVGTGMGAAFVVPVATVTKWFTHNRGLALGIVASGVGVGQMILPPLMRYMITEFGWRTTFAIVGMMVCVVGIPAALLLRNSLHNTVYPTRGKVRGDKTKSDGIAKFQSNWSVTGAIKTSSFYFLLFIFISISFGVVIITSHLAAHVEDIGFDPLRAAFVLTLIGIGGIFGRILIGKACDKIGSNIMLTSCEIVQALLLFSLIQAESLWAFYVIATLFGLTYGGAVPALVMRISEFFGVSSSGAIFGTLIFGATAGAAIGAPFAGYIYDVTGNYAIAFLTGGIVLTVGSGLSFIAKPPKKNPS